MKYTTPAGFTQAPNGIYSPLVPLEDEYQATYFIPTSDKNLLDDNIISVFLYALPAGADVTSTGEQKAQVEAYNQKLKATISGPISNAVVAGIEGLQEDVHQPTADPSKPTLNYATWFVFGTQHFLQLGCQVGTPGYADVIGTACTALLNSLVVS